MAEKLLFPKLSLKGGDIWLDTMIMDTVEAKPGRLRKVTLECESASKSPGQGPDAGVLGSAFCPWRGLSWHAEICES